MTIKIDHSAEAYIIADYLLTAAIRLRICPRAVWDNVREHITSLPTDQADVKAALAFLNMMECGTDDEPGIANAELLETLHNSAHALLTIKRTIGLEHPELRRMAESVLLGIECALRLAESETKPSSEDARINS